MRGGRGSSLRGGEAGAVIMVRGGYVLGADGLIDEGKNQDTDMTYYAVASGESFVFFPCEYLGMRYVQIDNSPVALTQENFSFIVRHAELDEARSAFESSDATLNAVWELCKRSVTLGAQEQFLDTPTREKGGFLVDSFNESLAAMMAYGERVLTRKTLLEFLDSMDHYWSSDEDRGRMNAVYPNGDGARDIPDFTQAYLVWVWEYYLQTGDRNFLRDHFSELKSIADYGLRYRNPATGLVEELRGGGGAYVNGIVDWPPSMRYGYDMETAARTVVNCYAYADCEIVASIARELGETADGDFYRARAEELKGAINRYLLQEVYIDGLHHDGTPSAHASQQANIFPLALGIVPQENCAAVLEHVSRLKMSAGMVTVYWLVRALGERNAGKHLLELYTNAEWDGWAKNLAQGASCTWESWDADLGGNLSQSHPWGAVGLCGIQQYILGVKPLAPQYERAQIKPLDFGDRLQFASGRVPTERADIFVRWERSDAGFELMVELPVNVRAEVWVPQVGNGKVMVDDKMVEVRVKDGFVGIGELGSGKYKVVVI